MFSILAFVFVLLWRFIRTKCLAFKIKKRIRLYETVIDIETVLQLRTTGAAYMSEADIERFYENPKSPFYQHPNVSTFDLKQFARLQPWQKKVVIEAKIKQVAG